MALEELLRALPPELVHASVPTQSFAFVLASH